MPLHYRYRVRVTRPTGARKLIAVLQSTQPTPALAVAEVQGKLGRAWPVGQRRTFVYAVTPV
jgi:hypothetical protein